MAGFGIERGDVLLSIELALTRDAEQESVSTGASESARPRTSPVQKAASDRPRRGEPGPGPGHPRAASVARPSGNQPSAPARLRKTAQLPWAGRIDPATGARGLEGLQRELSAALRSGRAERLVLLCLAIRPLAQIRLVMGASAAGKTSSSTAGVTAPLS